jgi:DNA-binding transcriptional ArsR family regulator
MSPATALTKPETPDVTSDASNPSAGLADADWSGAAADPLVPPTLEALDLGTILHALSDPLRMRIVAELANGGERTCGSFELPITKSTCSHHFRVLREAGVVSQRVDGKCRLNRLRVDALEQRFPGLLDSVLRASRA